MKPLRKFSEQDLTQLFSGRAPAEGSGLDDLSALVRKVQSSFAADVEPTVEAAHLESLIQTVHLTDKGDLAARPASKVTGPHAQASGLPKLRRRFMLESLFASLAAKIAAGGIAIAMAAVPVAATGNLPDHMQTGISEAVEHIGIDIPVGASAEAALDVSDEEEAEDDLDLDEGGTGDISEGTDENGTGNQEGEQKGPNENAAFGQSVAADARDGGVDGQEISERAHARNEERKAAREDGTGEEGEISEGDVSDGPIDTLRPGGKPEGVGGGKPEGVGGGKP